MSFVFGVFNKNGNQINKNKFEDTMRIIGDWNPDKSDIWINDDIAIGNHLLYTTPESFKEKLPYYHQESGCCITADARIDYREELAQQLGSKWENKKNSPDSEFILEAYLKWGEDCLDYLYGDFAFAIWDERLNKLFCARDHFGCRPFYYYDNADLFVFSSDIRAFSHIVSSKLDFDKEWIANCLAFTNPERSNSPIEDVLRLKPSYKLIVSAGITNTKQYWELCEEEDYSNYEENELVSIFQDKLKASISNRLRSAYPVGTELSGGLDSSGITAIAANLSEETSSPLLSFSHVLSEELHNNTYPFEDEYDVIQKTIKHIPSCRNIPISGRDIGALQAIEENLYQLGYPVVKGYAIMCDQLYKAASKEDVRVLLSGFGGDQGVSSPALGIFSELSNFKDRRTLINELKRYANRKGFGLIWFLKRVASYILPMHITKLLVSSLGRNKKVALLNARYSLLAISESCQKKLNTRQRFMLLYNRSQSLSLKEQLKDNLSNNFVPLRFEDSCLTSKRYQIDYRYPLWDVKLLRFYYSLPAKMKFNNGIGRYIYRKAIEGMLPTGFCWDIDKAGSTTVPNVQSRLKLDVEKLYYLITEGQNNNYKHFVDYNKMRSMIEILLSRDFKKQTLIDASFLFTYVRILLLQKWKREGKIDIGINC